LCTAYYNDTHIVINNYALILDCNDSTLDGFNDTGTGITISNQDTVQITNCTIKDYETGMSFADSINSSVWDNTFISNDLYDINTYRTTYTWFTTNDMLDGATSIRLDDTSTDNIIIGNNINNMTDYGISLNQNCDNNTIYGNTITNIGLPSGGYCIANSNVNNTYIYGNTLRDCGYGIDANESDSIQILNNDIFNNYNMAIRIDNIVGNNTVADIQDNTINNSGYDCVDLDGLVDSNVSYNDVSGCGANGGCLTCAAILLENSSGVTFHYNVVHDNHYDGLSIISLFDSNITTSMFNNNNYGMTVEGESSNNIITGSGFINNTNVGLMMEDYASYYTNISTSSFNDNGIYGMFFDCSEMIPADHALFIRLESNRVNNSSVAGIMVSSCDNMTFSNTNSTYNAQDGMYMVGDNRVNGGYLCNNNQTGGAFYDVVNVLSGSAFTGVACDYDNPNTTCGYACSATLPTAIGITVILPGNASYNNTTWQNITLNVTSGVSSCRVLIDGTYYTLTNDSGNWNYLPSTMTNTTHYSRFLCNDTLNNWYSTTSIYYTIISGIEPPVTCTATTPINKAIFDLAIIFFALGIILTPFIMGNNMSIEFIIMLALAVMIIGVFAPSLMTLLC
jgi:hypothetical protein